MTWTYNTSALTVSTAAGRLNSVRLLVGDTDTTDQQIQDEEIAFALEQSNDNTYTASVFVCRLLAAKYSRLVTTMADRGVSSNYSDQMDHYNTLATQIEVFSKKVSGKSLGIFVGGVLISGMAAVEADTDRVPPEFIINQFDNPTSDSSNNYPIGV